MILDDCGAYFSWPPAFGNGCHLDKGHDGPHQILMPAWIAEYVNAGYRGEANEIAGEIIRKYRGDDTQWRDQPWDTVGVL